MTKPANNNKNQDTPKRPYHKPRLSLLGGIEEVTQGGFNGSVEFGMGMMSMGMGMSMGPVGRRP